MQSTPNLTLPTRPITAWLNNIAVLAGFGLVAFWGHKTHWTMILGHPEEDQVVVVTSPASVTTGGTGDSLEQADKPRNSKEILFEESAGNVGVEIAPVRKDHVQEKVLATAMVDYSPQRIARLSTRAEGHVRAVYVKIGDDVHAGEVLALVDSQLVGEAKSDWLQKVAASRFRKQTLSRLRQAGEEAVPGSRLREAEAAFQEAELSSFMAQQRLSNLSFTMDDIKLDFAKEPKAWSDQVRFLGIPTSIVEKLPKVDATANLIAISTPFDGVIVEQEAVTGEVVSPDEYQFVVADTSVMSVRLSIRREDAGKLRVGQTVEFTAEGTGDAILTRLAWVSSEIDETTRMIQAGCTIDNPALNNVTHSATEGEVSSSRMLRAKMFGSAKICVAEHPNAMLIPTSAIQRMPDQQSIVFVSDQQRQRFSPRIVRVGLMFDGSAQILEGIRDGESVVSEGSFILKSEMMRSSLVGG